MQGNDIIEHLLKTMLIDVATAQHHANVYTANLAKFYADPLDNNMPESLQYFPVSSPVIQSFSLNIKFALEDLNNYLINNTQTIVQDLVYKIADSIESATEQLIAKDDLVNQIVANVKQLIVKQLQVYKVENNTLTQQQLRDFLQSAVRASFATQSYSVGQAVESVIQSSASDITQWSKKTYEKTIRLQASIFGDITPVYDFNLLDGVKETILCSITVNIDMNNLRIGFKDKNDTSDPNQPSYLLA